eukprot:CAMPEP_0197835654 /NCGR_PEP_ID=MMETSP1437-20131217/26543_1 /TAXON_ID=49252 ORGANISM="Eucampia antarctica, Strain CCMP1452" /NCGR_SAMPLE_ID=MMETSP1437 /ASSEMBLY_ACC=CAM_ASM_001096 /LENGTH=291 /DNA_ID=CAMNT_0043441259 /DNA_START=130 /DNA_END=1002 /DNA_ORIENTATION=+
MTAAFTLNNNNFGCFLSNTKAVLPRSSSSCLFESSDVVTKDVVAPKIMEVPLTVDEMIKQVASTIADARSSEYNINRQIIRILLPRDINSVNLGQYYENQDIDDAELILVPPDESWQGGIMQLYRAAVPTCQDILKRLCNTYSITGIPPKLIEDRSVDESGVDGVGLIRTVLNDNEDPNGPDNQIYCYVQPLQESVPYIFKNLQSVQNDKDNSQLTILINPQWRIVDDVLDTASKMDGFFGSVASFLGGKGGVLKQLDDANFQNVYVLEGYVCKNRNVRLFKRFDTNWTIW